MDKKIHKKLNIMESICVLVVIICMGVSAMLHIHSIKILNAIFMVVSSISELMVIAIELLFLYLENKKYRFFTIAFYIIELLLTMLVNINIPFAGLFILITFSIIKNIFRVNNVEIIYQPLGYYELCKKYGIKVKKPRKTRVNATKKASTSVNTKKKRSVKEEPTFA